MEEERLADIKGIGKALAEKITELVNPGKLAYYDELKASIPEGLIAMLNTPGLGPKKVKAVYSKLGIERLRHLSRPAKKQTRRAARFWQKDRVKNSRGH
ncbi:MAG: hypothetical protein CM1200mP29_05390 [Verrucomicrobiota bacterium]|nr:MAG: hypothetical protein CM1200mP29_05390 [Verrucomicrobiota bacterium]